MAQEIGGVNGRRIRCLRTTEEIAEYIGEGARAIGKLVLDEGLPAWKRNGCGPWRAIDIDLDNWMWTQRQKYFGRRMLDAQNEEKGVNSK